MPEAEPRWFDMLIKPWTPVGLKQTLLEAGYPNAELDERPGRVVFTVRISRWWWLCLGLVHRKHRINVESLLEPIRPLGIVYTVRVR